MDLFVVPTIGFDLLYALVIVRLDRRDMVWINVTQNPTAEWIARQITEAFPWNDTPRYLIRDRDRIYGDVALPTPIARHGHPRQTHRTDLSLAERFCRTRINPARVWIISRSGAKGHSRRILRAYARYYNGIRTHRLLDKMRPPFALFNGSATRGISDSRRTPSPLRPGLSFRYPRAINSSARDALACSR